VIADQYEPKFEKILAQDVDLMVTDWKGQYTMTFWLKQTSSADTFMNIFHKGHDDKERNPSIWILPSSSNLHVRSGTPAKNSSSESSSSSWASGPNVGCDPKDSLEFNAWNFVGVVHQNQSMEVFFADPSAKAIRRTCFRFLDAPAHNTGPLYSAAPAGAPFLGVVADVRLYNRAMSQGEVHRIAKQKVYAKGHQLK